jgi:NADPH:quinone reductase-like Zn-dependent oxidoreductase
MEAVVLTGFGQAPTWQITERPVPEPGPGEVLVSVKASPINPSDLIFIYGRNKSRKKLPTVPGFEGSGVVVKSGGGEEADTLVGKHVAFRTDRDGAWAQYAVVDPKKCIPLLPSVSFTAGAMLLVNPLTAWTLVDCAQKGGHKCAIQNAAASALGRMVIKFAAERKLETINIVRRKEQVELLKSIGAQHVLNSESSDFDADLNKLAREHNATVAFDAIAGSAANGLLKAMPKGSQLWSYGGLSGQPLEIDPISLIYDEKSVHGFWGPPTFYKLSKREFEDAANEIQKSIETTFKSDVHRTFPLRDFTAALEEYEQNMTRGKVLFVISD